MLRGGSFIAEERQGGRGRLHGYMASWKIDMGRIETSVHQMVEFTGLFKKGVSA